MSAVGICGVLAGIEVAQTFGAEVPRAFALFTASAAAVVAATVAVRAVAFIWRGPVIVPFPRDEALLCDAREAAVVRSVAQLRGTMGGAGHVHPRRLVLSATAWGAISVQALALVTPQRTPGTFVPIAVALVAAALAALFPATAFFYREAAAGCVLAFPSDVCRRLLDANGVEPALQPIALGALELDPRGAGADRPGASEGGAARPDPPTRV